MSAASCCLTRTLWCAGHPVEQRVDALAGGRQVGLGRRQAPALGRGPVAPPAQAPPAARCPPPQPGGCRGAPACRGGNPFAAKWYLKDTATCRTRRTVALPCLQAAAAHVSPVVDCHGCAEALKRLACVTLGTPCTHCRRSAGMRCVPLTVLLSAVALCLGSPLAEPPLLLVGCYVLSKERWLCLNT